MVRYGGQHQYMKPRILLTGDDGYQSIGTRLVIRALQDKAELTVVATKAQMSGVGGHVSMKTGASFGQDIVDGVKAHWIDGYPADAMEYVAGNFPVFNYVISGLNLGANVGAGWPSGTVSAAMHALGLCNAKKAIILSWHVGKAQYLRQHDGDESLDAYLSYPLIPMTSLLEKIITHDAWGAEALNINFPEASTSAARFTTPLDNLQTFYNYPVEKDASTNHFSYLAKHIPSSTQHASGEEVGALLEHVISITPWRKTLFFKEVYNAMAKKDMQL